MFSNTKPSGPENSEQVFQSRYVYKDYLADHSWSSNMWDERMMSSNTSYFQGLLDLMVSEVARAGMSSIGVGLYPLGRKAMTEGSDSSAFPHRNTIAVLSVFYRGGNRSDRTESRNRIQSYLEPFSTGTYLGCKCTPINQPQH